MKNTCLICNSDPQPLKFQLGPFALDEKLHFVEHVLDVLSESRTGHPRLYRLAEAGWQTWWPMLVTAFYDLTAFLRMHAQRFFSNARFQFDRLTSSFTSPLRRAKYIYSLYLDQHAALKRAFARIQFPAPLARGSPRPPTESIPIFSYQLSVISYSEAVFKLRFLTL